MASCYRCGVSTSIEGLCWSCKSKDEQALLALKRTADAAEASQRAAEAALDAEFDREQERGERRERKAARKHEQQQRQWLAEFAEWPDGIQAAFTDRVKTKNDLYKYLLTVADRLGDISFNVWLEIREHAPNRFDLAYKEVRTLLVPAILRLWKERHSMAPPPDKLLGELASAFVYPDFARPKTILAQWESAQTPHNGKLVEMQEAEAAATKKRIEADEWKRRAWSSVFLAGCLIVPLWFACSRGVWFLAILGIGFLEAAVFHFLSRAANRSTAEAKAHSKKEQSIIQEFKQTMAASLRAKDEALAKLRDPELAVIVQAAGKSP